MAYTKLDVKDLFKDNWLPANTSSVTPSFCTGWYNFKNEDPQVTVTDSEETPVSTGRTGYFGLSTGGVPVQYWDGSIAINCWVTREGTTVNPKLLIEQFVKEIKRIVRANYDNVTGLDYIAWQGGFDRVEKDKTPVVFRYVGQVGLGYLE